MKFKIPLTSTPLEKLKRRSESYKKFFNHKKNSKLQGYLENSDIGVTREEYLGICLKILVRNFLFLLILSLISLYFTKVKSFILISLGISLLISFFILLSQLNYPKVYNNRKQREIERNLIPALEDMLVQLNSGIPLFTILVNISSSNYQALSDEFRRAVKKINSGFPQAEVLEKLGDTNPSLYFRRALWQISNGMRAGSDISLIIKESIKSLSEEQILQIQSYGNKLNPLIMFYMLMAVIMPALAITFLTILTSLLNLSGTMIKLMFISLGTFVILLQVMFIGTIKSLRPSLM